MNRGDGAGIKLPDLGYVVDAFKARKGGRGLRAVAREIGISPTTASRFQRGFIPDWPTLEKIVAWINLAPTLPGRLAHLMSAHDIDQKVFAARTGISQATISRARNGARDLSATNLLAIADTFDVTTDWLLGRSP